MDKTSLDYDIEKILKLPKKEKEELLELIIAKEIIDSKNNFDDFSERCLKITNKNSDVVSFKLNGIQKRINDKIDELRKQKIPPRIIILKARQEGVSTYYQGRVLHKTSQNANRNGLVIAHMDKSTKAIFEKSKFMYRNLPEEVKPLQRLSNSTELVFDLPSNYKGNDQGLNSKIIIQTAGSQSIGRSDTYHIVHISEYAFWEGSDEKSPDKQLAGIMASVPKTLDTEVLIESTAKGFNHFKDLWDDAVAGRNSWYPMFFSWMDHDEYRFNLSMEEEDGFLDTLSEYERWLYSDMGASFEQIKWYRYTLRTDCNNDHNLMKQEYPTTAEEAFISSGTPVFDIEKVMKRIEALRSIKYKEGYFTFEWHSPEYKDYIIAESIKFIPSKQKNYIRIYTEVKNKKPYVIAGDTKGEGSDFYSGQVLDNSTGHRVATLHMQVNNSKPYTWQMYCLGMYYNKALLGIEMNFNTAPIEELQRLNYPRQYVRRKYDDFKKRYEDKYGWKTDGTTRPLIVDKEISLVEEDMGVFYDIPTLQEMLTFQYDKDGRPDAMSGKHDDLLMADMILNEIRSQQRTGFVDINSPRLPKNIPEDYKEDYWNASKEDRIYLLKKWEKAGLYDNTL